MYADETLRQRRRRKVIYAQGLRKRMTRAESVLWDALRGRKCAGMKFRRQAPVEWFVVDFLCVEQSLVVEVDGPVHARQRDYDLEREGILRQKRLKVLRFENNQVLGDLPTVLSAIQSASKLPPSPCGSVVQGGRGGKGVRRVISTSR